MKKRILAVSAGLLALFATTALAVWLVIGLFSVTSTFNTSAVIQGAISGFGNTCNGPESTDLWAAVPDGEPGRWTTGVLCLENTAGLAETYALSSSNTDTALAAATLVQVTSAGVAADVTAAAVLSCVFHSIDTDGVPIDTGQPVVFSGSLDTLAVGDPAFGAQADDRPLAAGEFEKLCFEVVLPFGADPAVAGLNNDFTLDVTASP